MKDNRAEREHAIHSCRAGFLGCRLIMSEFSTPKTMYPSSAFMTPPDSNVKDTRTHALANISPIPVFSLISPLNERLSSPQDAVDFISSFYLRFNHISHHIISYLSPPDFISCLSVCRRWREAILSSKVYINKIKDYKKQLKENKENHPSMANLQQSIRKPLTNLPTNVTPFNTHTGDIVNKHLSKLITPEQGTSLRPCPQCSSPAKRINQDRALCNVCQFDFCCRCFKKSHQPSICSGSTSPKRRSEITHSIAGSKNSKKRLKRL